MKTIEQRISELESKVFDRALTQTEKERWSVETMLKSAKLDLSNEQGRHQVELMRINRKLNNLTNLRRILFGATGFMRCSQGQLEAESGFTTVGEVIGYVGKPFVDVYMERPSCPFGMEVWAIDDRGMMTLVDAVIDSSD